MVPRTGPDAETATDPVPATRPATTFPRVLRIGISVVLLVAVIAVLAAGFRRDPHDIKTGTVGHPAPAFDLERLDGTGRLSLAQYAGKVVVLNFWASWCIPCKEENPALAAVYERYRTSDATLIGIVYQDSPQAAREYTERMGNTWPSVLDEDGRIAIAYGVFGIPETFFIGTDGVIAGRHIGPIDERTLINGIEALRPRR